MSTFAQLNLHDDIFKAINVCGYTTPTPIQAQSIPVILNGDDIVASAQTGTGKTASFVLPALHKLCLREAPAKETRILILTPTRELASQITKAASTYGKFLRFNVVSLVGGMSYHHQIKDLSRGATIIVATPGRLIDHMEQNRVNLSNVEMLILDEADRMLDMGFIDDVQFIAGKTPTNRQTLLFSATVDNKLAQAVQHLLKNPTRIDLSQKKLTAPDITQEFYRVQNIQQKTRLLTHLLANENIYKAIIFSATKMHADKLAYQLRAEGFEAAALHGDLKQNVRNRTIDQLRRGKIQYLVATDVAARGIDIQDITHVINFDLPRSSEDYVHRIGRTGRAGRKGIAISFLLPMDTKHLQRIERYVGQRFKISATPDMNTGAVNVTNKHETTIQEKPEKKFQSRNISRDRDNDLHPAQRENKFERKEKRFSRDEHRSSRSSHSPDEHRFSRKPYQEKSENDVVRKDRRSEGRGWDRDDDLHPAQRENKFERKERNFSRDENRSSRSSHSRDENRSSRSSHSRDEHRSSRSNHSKYGEGKPNRDDNRSKQGENKFSRHDRKKPAEGRFERDKKNDKSFKEKHSAPSKKNFSSKKNHKNTNDFADKPMKNKKARDKKESFE